MLDPSASCSTLLGSLQCQSKNLTLVLLPGIVSMLSANFSGEGKNDFRHI